MSYKFSDDSLNLIYTLKLQNSENFSKLINAYSKIKILEDTKDQRAKVLISIWEKEFNKLITPYLQDNIVKLNENYQSPIGNDLSNLNVTQKPDPNLNEFLNKEKAKNMKKIEENNDTISGGVQIVNDVENQNDLNHKDDKENNLDLFLQETTKDFSNENDFDFDQIQKSPKPNIVLNIADNNQKINVDSTKSNELGSIEHKVLVEKTIEYNDKMIFSLKEEIKNQKILTKQQRKERKLQKRLNKLKTK